MTKKLSVLQRTGIIPAALFVAALFALVFVFPGSVHAALLTQTLDFGDSNADVTSLQTYLATDASIYPSELVTGYFGPLTQAGVQKFQISHGIVTTGTPETTGFGRVGPMTLAKINALMGGTGSAGSNVAWDTVPVLSSVIVERTNTSATLLWTTNEPTTGQVYWGTSPLIPMEATGPREQPYVNGTLVLDTGGQLLNHSVTIPNLQPNTTYYYTVRSVDFGGNMSMTWPTTFRTNN